MGLKYRFFFSFILSCALFCARSFAAEVSQTPNAIKTFDPVTLSTGPASFDLKQYFSYPGVTGEVAQFTTVLGTINVDLLASDAPRTVTNFKSYITDGSYDNTIIHRSMANFVIQGGGYKSVVPGPPAVTQKTAVVNEYKISNTRGTIAMAKLPGDPNSATDEWFFNLANNSANLDAQNGGFTVFGRVIGGGMTVVDAIAALQIWIFPSAGFDSLPLRNFNGTVNVAVSNFVTVNTIRIVPVFPDGGTSGSVVKFTAVSSNTAAVTTSLSGSQLTVTRVGPGTAQVTITATDSNNRVASSVLDVQAAGAPVFETQPRSAQVVKGGTLALFASATGFPSYQWRRDGVAISNATSNALVIEGVTAAEAGTYSVVATGTTGTATSSDAMVTITDSSSTIISALAVRTYLGAAQTLTVGFATAGARDVLVTGVGPSIPGVSAADSLPDPQLQLKAYPSLALVGENNDWPSSIKATIERLKGVGVLPTGSKDSALVANVSGFHTALVTGTNSNSSGIVMSEVYDAGSGTAGRLTAISVLNFSGTDNKVLIAGFIIAGDSSKTVLIRGLGPTLPSGVPNRLMDPKLELYDLPGTMIAANDDWPLSLEATMVKVFGNAPARGSKDAAILITLAPGVYMAHVKGVASTTGQAMVEVYEVN